MTHYSNCVFVSEKEKELFAQCMQEENVKKETPVKKVMPIVSIG